MLLYNQVYPEVTVEALLLIKLKFSCTKETDSNSLTLKTTYHSTYYVRHSLRYETNVILMLTAVSINYYIVSELIIV